ncbi:hypothetical protein VNI00_010207 [Paramarasmius palmivorus]|uniref:Uncharacterized protein n=1 Tax=Paramarasmius palmivorus TaxID=297713 RepID=A0AAW0CJM3_9AGAR
MTPEYIELYRPYQESRFGSSPALNIVNKMMTSNQSLVWLITGTSVGIGTKLALAAIGRGDQVIVTDKSAFIEQVTSELGPKRVAIIELDVTSPLETLVEIAKTAISIYGRVDVIVNNANEILVGHVEKNTPEESFQQFNTNVFGALNVIRAFLPHMHFSHQSACLDQRTDNKYGAACIEDYMAQSTDQYNATFREYRHVLNINHNKAVNVIIDIVRGEGCVKDKTLCGNIVLGTQAHVAARKSLEKNAELLDAWEDVSSDVSWKAVECELDQLYD